MDTKNQTTHENIIFVATQAWEKACQSQLSAKDIHDIRLACKRVRAILRATHPFINKDSYHEVDGRVKNISHCFNQHRDMRVADKLLQQMQKTVKARHASKLDVLRKSILRQSQGEEAQLTVEGLADDWWSVVKQLGTIWPDVTDQQLLSEGVMLTYTRVRKSAEHANEDIEHSHEWRKWIKYLYFQLDTIQSARSNPQCTEYAERLKILGEILGERHDIYVVLRFLADSVNSQEALSAYAFLLRLLELREEKFAKKMKKASKRLLTLSNEEFFQSVLMA